MQGFTLNVDEEHLYRTRVGCMLTNRKRAQDTRSYANPKRRKIAPQTRVERHVCMHTGNNEFFQHAFSWRGKLKEGACNRSAH